MKHLIIPSLLSVISLSAFASTPQLEGHTKELKLLTFGDDISVSSQRYTVRCTHHQTDKSIDKYTQHRTLTYTYQGCSSPNDSSLDSTKAYVMIFRDIDANSWSIAIGNIDKLNVPVFSNLYISSRKD